MDENQVRQDVHQALEESVRQLIIDRRDLLESLQNLVSKLDEIDKSADFSGVFQMASIHGYEYKGPNWGEELTKAKELLEEFEDEGTD